MLSVGRALWPLYLGLGLFMVGNGLQGTLLGVRGPQAGFSNLAMSAIMAGYFAGFLVSSSLTPALIRNVGHMHVFAALGSMISAVLILYPVLTYPAAWVPLRFVIGFCFCGVYITAESWLNEGTDTTNRGAALSLYMIVQMAGITGAQGIVSFGDPSGYELFILSSVLVSLALAPVLLTAQRTPAFARTKPMSLREVWHRSPLGIIGMFLVGGVFAGQFGMAAVYASNTGLTLRETSAFVAAFYAGALLFQFPIGWLSDRLDRRLLILVAAAGGTLCCGVGILMGESYGALLVTAFLVGGLSNPLYALIIAHVNDLVDYDDMPAVSGRLLFVNGIGAILGPFAIGGAFGLIGPAGFWAAMAGFLGLLAIYAAWRMTRRAAPEDTSSYAPVTPVATAVALEAFAEEMEAEGDADAGRAA